MLAESLNISSQPPNLSSQDTFHAKIQTSINNLNPSFFLTTSAISIILATVSYSQKNYPLTIAGLTISTLALGKFCSTQNTQNTISTLKKDLDLLQKTYPYKKFFEMSENLNKDLKRILEGKVKEFSHTLPSNTSLVNDLLEFVIDQLNDASAIEDDYNKTFSFLLEQIETRLTDFSINIKTIESHIQKDIKELEQTFFRDQNEPLKEFKIEFSSGETHSKGNRACYVIFNNNPNLKLVYKPRNVTIDAILTDSTSSLFHSLNTFASNQLIPTHRILAKEDYGYAEFLSNEKKDNVLTLEEMKIYYQSIGAIQAVAQTFGIRDLHQENVIVHAKKPYLIDLEVAFNVESLLLSQETELAAAIRSISRSEQNMVELKVEEKIISMKEHYQTNQKIYEISIEEGFNKMKAVISKHRDEIKEWVKNLPENLLMRIVPIDTITFQSILRTKVLDQSEEILFTINGSTNMEVLEMKETISKKETDLDVLHHDVPFFQMDLQGNCYYQGKVFWQFSESCQKLISDKIDDIESLEIPESFREIIRLPITHD